MLHVSEYILFDPHEEYFKPSLQGFRLREGVYVPITHSAEGRLYSEQLGLEMGRVGPFLRLYEPATGQMLLTWKEQYDLLKEAPRQAEADQQQEEVQRQQAEAERLELADALRQSEEARRASEREQEELRRELEELRRRVNKPT